MPVSIGWRELITALGSAAVAWLLAARAQQPIRCAGLPLMITLPEGDPEPQKWLAAFRSQGSRSSRRRRRLS